MRHLKNAFVLVGMAYASNALALCVQPVVSPTAAPRTAWSDVLNAKAPASLNSAITMVQDISSTGVGDVNLDFYSITFDSGGKSAAQWVEQFRQGLDKYIYQGTSYSVAPFDSASAALWKSSAPRGALMQFNLAALFGVPFERGAVVVSCADATTFIFSTVSISGALNPGDHPVSGNRGFGVVKNPDGSMTLFTKAADRMKGNNASFAVLGSDRIFALGASVWQGLVTNLTTELAAYKPRNPVSHRRTEAWQ